MLQHFTTIYNKSVFFPRMKIRTHIMLILSTFRQTIIRLILSVNKFIGNNNRQHITRFSELLGEINDLFCVYANFSILSNFME